ncbi:MAG: O-methyltransferase [Vicinamibacterales bacterium]
MSLITPEPILSYLDGLRPCPHPELDVVLAEGRAAGVPIVSPAVGALLHALARGAGATRALEIGTAIGYSGLWIATALGEGGQLVSIERDAARATTARAHFAAAGLDDRVSVMVGDASRYLHKVAGPFDLIFQDADKTGYGPMLDRLIGLLRPGGLLVTDNVLWDGEVVPGLVAEPRRRAEDTEAIATYNRQLAADPRLFTTVLPVGDGVALAVKRALHQPPEETAWPIA